MAGTDCVQYRYFRKAHFCRPYILRQLGINLFDKGAYDTGVWEDYVIQAIDEESVHADDLVKKPIRQFVNHLARRAAWRAIEAARREKHECDFPQDNDNELTTPQTHDPTPPDSYFGPEVEDFTITCERKILIERALEAMPKLRRSVFKTHLEGYTVREVALMFDMSVQAVQRHIQRAHQDVKAEFEAD